MEYRACATCGGIYDLARKKHHYRSEAHVEWVVKRYNEWVAKTTVEQREVAIRRMLRAVFASHIDLHN